MHCFYITPPGDGFAFLPGEEAKHAARVLRLSPGDEISAMDGEGNRWRAQIDRMDPEGVRVRLIGALPSNESPLRLTVYQGVPKADKLDFIAQKLTELGAAELVPVKMERCVARPDEKDGRKRRERLSRIAMEAAKQCRRAMGTEIAEPMTWKRAMEHMAAQDLVLVPWEEASGRRMRDVFSEHPGARSVGIVVGPEGGMSAGEVEALQAMGALAVTLGPRILRTETASVAAAAVAMSLWGDI